MKMKKILSLLLATCFALVANAQLESGKVYRFVNKADTGVAMAAVSTTEVYGETKTDGKFAQLWMAETHPNNSNAWSLRSLGNGLYLTPRGTSTVWTFSSVPSAATVLYSLNVTGSYYTLNSSTSASAGTCMHYATSQGGAVVGWYSSADATQWTIEEVSVTADELQANWDELNELNSMLDEENIAACQATLNNLFTDAACTTLKKTFANEAAIEADADYQALPATLQNMVKKVFSGDWSEANSDSNKPGWDNEHSKKFRVQMYEPYSMPDNVANAIGTQGHANHNNPTGIFAGTRDAIYVMVEGEIETGAELYLSSLIGTGKFGSGYKSGSSCVRLKSGLNVVPYYSDNHSLWIQYVIPTFDNLGRKQYKLSDFPDLKIHIEGGHLNGAFRVESDELYAYDTDEDWEYYCERATQAVVPVLGRHMSFIFPLNDADTEGNKGLASIWPELITCPDNIIDGKSCKIHKIIEAWDRIVLSEFLMMGLVSKDTIAVANAKFPRWCEYNADGTPVADAKGEVFSYNGEGDDHTSDYGDYINHRPLAYAVGGTAYMYGTWGYTGYHYNTMQPILCQIADNAGNAWGPAHEIGHQHQLLLNMNGLTEVTNNLFSNVAVWYMGMATSRTNWTNGDLGNVYDVYQSGGDFFNNNIWALTHMYYRLWLYYHLAGHNTKFYPRLFEILRHDRISYGGDAYGVNTILKFYKHACVAAGEDLTDFFRAFGFFRVMDAREVGDYSSSTYYQTQEEIDEAIAWVKALGYKENIAPLFCNDYVFETTYSHDGVTPRDYWEGNEASSAQLGLYTHCITNEPVEGYYYQRTNYVIDIKKTDNAKGALGFAIYRGDDLIAFTNNYTVKMPNSVGVETVEVYAVQADGTLVPLLTAAESGTESEQLAALTAQINTAASIIAAVAADSNDAGFYYAEDAAELIEVYNNAVAAKNNSDQSVHTYGKWASMLEQEVNELLGNDLAYIRIKEGNFYTLYNKQRPQYGLTYTSNGLQGTQESQYANDSAEKLWEFVSTGTEGEYYIRNKNGNYITKMLSGITGAAASDNQSSAIVFVVARNNINGCYEFAVKSNPDLYMSYNHSSKIVCGGENNTAARWTLKVVEDNASAGEKEELAATIETAKNVLNTVCISYTDEAVKYAEGLTILNNNIDALVYALVAAIDTAEENIDTTHNYYKYIAALEEAMSAISGAYYVAPKASTADAPVWYYIKNVETGLYCGINENGTGSTALATTFENIAGKENNPEFWWSFTPTGGENEYTIANAYNGNSIYERRGYLVISTENSTPYILSLDDTGLTIFNGEKYWVTTNATYVQLNATDNIGHWALEEVPVRYTGIEAVTEEVPSSASGIYDLFGRKIDSISAPGLYIINGKKVIIK